MGPRAKAIAVDDSSCSAELIGLPLRVVCLSVAYDGSIVRRAGVSAGPQPAPHLAAAPRRTAGGTSYTFRLRPGIRYSDGRPLRAADFRRALAHNLQVNGPVAPFFAGLAGASACIHHHGCDLSRSVTVEGRSTLTFRLPAPDPQLFGSSPLAPIPAGISLRDAGTTPVPSTGPYVIESYRPGHLLTFVATPTSTSGRRPRGRTATPTRSLSSPRMSTPPCVTNAAGPTSCSCRHRRPRLVRDLAAHHPLQLHSQAPAGDGVRVPERPPPTPERRPRSPRAQLRRRPRARCGTPRRRARAANLPGRPPDRSGLPSVLPVHRGPHAVGGRKAPRTNARALIRASGTR